MAENIRSTGLKAAFVASLAFASVLLLLWDTVAYAQSREDQYGSPTDTVDRVSRASDTLSGTLGVLPETGGPLILLIGVAFVVAGAGLAIVGRRGEGR